MSHCISATLARDARLGTTTDDEPRAHIQIELAPAAPGDAPITATWLMPGAGFATLYAARALANAMRRGTPVHLYCEGPIRWGGTGLRARNVTLVQLASQRIHLNEPAPTERATA